jgi:hypothetical protein
MGKDAERLLPGERDTPFARRVSERRGRALYKQGKCRRCQVAIGVQLCGAGTHGFLCPGIRTPFTAGLDKLGLIEDAIILEQPSRFDVATVSPSGLIREGKDSLWNSRGRHPTTEA